MDRSDTHQMEAYDYPIQHFEIMRDLAGRLKAVPVQIFEHTYRYDAFGSWWLAFMKRGERYRIVYDGKESVLRIEQNADPPFSSDWRELLDVPCEDNSVNSVIEKVLSLIDPL